MKIMSYVAGVAFAFAVSLGSASAGHWDEIEHRTCTAKGLNATQCEAKCSRGYQVILGGCSAEGSPGNSQVGSSRPTSNYDGWICATSIDKTDKGTAKATGYAICSKPTHGTVQDVTTPPPLPVPAGTWCCSSCGSDPGPPPSVECTGCSATTATCINIILDCPGVSTSNGTVNCYP